jgi:hypothetical protein
MSVMWILASDEQIKIKSNIAILHSDPALSMSSLFGCSTGEVGEE